MKLHIIFLSVIWQTSRGKYQPNEAGNFFLYALSICKYSYKFITNRLEITDDSFFDELIPIVFLMN
jgi:hypothetical protein